MEQNLNLPPFYIGQKVVALATSQKICDNQVIKDQVYTVEGCTQCTCGKWVVTLFELPNKFPGEYKMCCIEKSPRNYAGGGAKYFAPIESTFAAITFKEVIEIESPVTCMQ